MAFYPAYLKFYFKVKFLGFLMRFLKKITQIL